jgi:hypothetical protein
VAGQQSGSTAASHCFAHPIYCACTISPLLVAAEKVGYRLIENPVVFIVLDHVAGPFNLDVAFLFADQIRHESLIVLTAAQFVGVTTNIVKALTPQLSRRERQQLGRRNTDNLKACEQFQEGQGLSKISNALMGLTNESRPEAPQLAPPPCMPGR